MFGDNTGILNLIFLTIITLFILAGILGGLIPFLNNLDKKKGKTWEDKQMNKIINKTYPIHDMKRKRCINIAKAYDSFAQKYPNTNLTSLLQENNQQQEDYHKSYYTIIKFLTNIPQIIEQGITKQTLNSINLFIDTMLPLLEHEQYIITPIHHFNDQQTYTMINNSMDYSYEYDFKKCFQTV